MQTICTTVALLAAAPCFATASADLTGPVIVTTSGPLAADARDFLEEFGLTLHGAAGRNRFIGSLRPGASLDVLTRLASIETLEPLAPEDRLDPALTGDAALWMDGAAENPATLIPAYVTLADPQGVEAVAAAGVQIVGSFHGDRALVVTGPLAAVQKLAWLDAVLYVEPALPPLEPTNDDNRARTGAETAQAPPYDIDGAGTTVFVFDGGGVRLTHLDFIGRVTLLDNAPPERHATHVAGTVAGSGAASDGQYRGMAPAAHILSARFQRSQAGIFFYTNPGDVELDYAAALAAAPDLAAANTSLGLNVTSNNFSCDLFGNYGATASLLDGFATGSLGKPLAMAWSAGNDRPGNCGSQYGTLSPPSAAKNPISVGAINSDDDSMTTFSSWGPTDDGRMKPDLCAPGDQVSGDGGVTSPNSSSNTGYVTLHGTSMASPTVTGLVALLTQDYRQRNPGAADPLPSTLKAGLMHTAFDIEQPGPDYRSGYGSVRVIPAIEAMRGGLFLEDELTTGEVAGFNLLIAPGDPELRLTMAWDDPSALPNTPSQLINDLDLVVLDPEGQRAFPWTLDPMNPDLPAVRTGEDHANNNEQVLVENPASGLWRVLIRGDIAEGPQTLSIFTSHALNPEGVRIRADGVIPALVSPATPTPIEVEITAFGETVTDATMFYRLAPEQAFQGVPMSPADGDRWSALLPPVGCADLPEVYFTATGSVTGVVSNPTDAPAAAYGLVIGQIDEPFADDFQDDQGWTITGQVSAGAWERGAPAGNGQRDPIDDFDGSGFCYVTGLGLNNDLDGGATTLTSPVFDATRGGMGGVATLRYARWFSGSGSDPSTDSLTVELSNDAGETWIELERIGPDPDGLLPRWVERTWTIGDVVTPTNAMQLRFIAEDTDVPSVIEAAVDAVRVSIFSCDDSPVCLCEVDANPGIDVFDLLTYLDRWFAAEQSADLDGVPGVDVFDLLTFLDCWFEGC